MPQGMSGNNWHPHALAGELEACVEGLVAKRRAVSARKDERRSREVETNLRIEAEEKGNS